MESLTRRQWLVLAAAVLARRGLGGAPRAPEHAPLKITGLKVTPVALPDPPILAASGCHGPYFLRNIVEIETDAGITGIGETHGGDSATQALESCRSLVVGRNAFAYRALREQLAGKNSAYAALELACLDACGRATGRRLCELLGGPVREKVEFAAYLFFRYAADDPRLLSDPRVADDRGRGDRALDSWGEVRTPETIAAMAAAFRKRWGFRVFKLKAGVLEPEVELRALEAMHDALGGKQPLRIDPNGRWKVDTALRAGRRLQKLPLEYYEDPVRGQQAMAEVRKKTGLPMSTNSCVTRFAHIPSALRIEPIDVVLGDHHGWGGIPAFQELGRICKTVGWGLSQHSNNHAGVTMAAMIHVGAVTPQLTFASDTHYPWLVEGADVIDGANLTIREGFMDVPTAPGLGVNLDRDKVARAHEVYRKCGMRRRDDAATMQRVVPGWKRSLY